MITTQQKNGLWTQIDEAYWRGVLWPRAPAPTLHFLLISGTAGYTLVEHGRIILYKGIVFEICHPALVQEGALADATRSGKTLLPACQLRIVPKSAMHCVKTTPNAYTTRRSIREWTEYYWKKVKVVMPVGTDCHTPPGDRRRNTQELQRSSSLLLSFRRGAFASQWPYVTPKTHIVVQVNICFL